MPQHVIEPFSSLVARVLRVWLFGLALSLFAAAVVSPCAAQPISGAEATDALAQAMRARGLTPPPDSDLSLEDHITSRTTGGGDRAARHVGFWIGPDGYVIPDAEWRDARPNYCKRQARYLRAPTQLIDFEIHRNTEKADGVTRNQLWVFARVTDAETGTMTNASEGKATNMTGVQREDEGYVADALEMAFADMGGLNPKAPAGPCGEVRLEHVQGTDVGDPFVFRAGFRGFGKALVYTWDFGDGSAPAEGRSLQVPTHVYDAEGTYEVSVRVRQMDGQTHTATISVEVEDEVAEPASCTFTAEVSGAISGTFEGTATVSFDSEGGTARATDLNLEGEGFKLSVGLAHRVGRTETLEGAMASASAGEPVVNTMNKYTGPLRGKKVTSEMQQIFHMQEESDFVTVEVQESRVIRWRHLPKFLRDYMTRMTSRMTNGEAVRDVNAMNARDRARYEKQVGDVAVLGIVRGQLRQTKLIEGLVEKAKPITFRAEFDAGSETLECDWEGFPEKMERRMSQMPQDVEQMRQKFEEMKEKMMEKMREGGQ